MMSRDSKGRFTQGNEFASTGGKARAQKLSRRRRRQIARRARAAMVNRHFLGDDRAQRDYFAALGVWNYERMAAVDVGLGASVASATRHPGTPSEFMQRRYQMSLFNPLVAEVDFRATYSKTGDNE